MAQEPVSAGRINPRDVLEIDALHSDEELLLRDTGARSFVSVQGSLAMFPIRAYGSEEQRLEWLPRLANAEAIGCFRSHRGGLGQRSSANVAVVWAQTDDGIRGFVVPTTTPGFSTNDIPGKLSLRASVTSELVLDDVRLPADAVLPGVAGMRGPLSCLSEARFGVLFGAVGAARACYESALDYSREREQFNKPIAGYQLTRRKLVDMMLKVNRAMLLALHIGRMKEANVVRAEHISLSKFDNV